MDVIDFDSDSDLENAIIEYEFLQKSRAPRTFSERKFSEEVSDIEFRQRYRVSREVIDYLTDRLTPLLQCPTKCNQPLSPREQIKMFLHFLGTNSFYHVLRDAEGPRYQCYKHV